MLETLKHFLSFLCLLPFKAQFISRDHLQFTQEGWASVLWCLSFEWRWHFSWLLDLENRLSLPTFCFSLLRIFNSNYFFNNLSSFLLLTEVSVSYFDFFSLVLLSCFHQPLSNSPAVAQVRPEILLSFCQLWSWNPPSRTEAFLCKAQACFQFLMEEMR